MSIVREALLQEIKELSAEIMEARENVARAKTDLKREYFGKKIKTASIKLAQVAEAIQRLDDNKKKMESNDESSVEEGRSDGEVLR